MRCEQARILLSQELDGELRADERAALEQHLSGCPECQRIRQAYCGIDAEIAGLEKEPPASLESGILERIHSEPIPVRPRRRPMWGIGTVAAVAAILALVVFSRGNWLAGTQGNSADSAPAAEEAMDAADDAYADSSGQTEAPMDAEFEPGAYDDAVMEDMEEPADSAGEYDEAAFDPFLWAWNQDATVLILENVTPEQAGLSGGEEIAEGAVSFPVSETQFRQLLEQWDGTVCGEGEDKIVLLLTE